MKNRKGYFEHQGRFVVDGSPFMFSGEEVDNILRASLPTERFKIRPVTNPEKVYVRHGRCELN